MHVGVGVFFLPEPPEEMLPIPDFCTSVGPILARPNPNLLDMVYLCQQRQEWFRDYARLHAQETLDFIGSVTDCSGRARGCGRDDSEQVCPVNC